MKTTDIDRLLQQAVLDGRIPGVVAYAADDRGVIYEGAFGQLAIDSSTNMPLDALFWLASMTKPITAVAALQLVESNRLQLDSALADIIPELSFTKVLEGFSESGDPRLRDPKQPITLRHLLTHTSGFTYDMWNADMVRYMEREHIPGITECKNETLKTPLVFDPGDRWEYGINFDWIGKVVEAVSGLRLNDYLKRYVFDPLKMNDTGFLIPGGARPRLAAMHQRMADNRLVRIDFEIPQQPEFFMGGGGLYGTAADYLKFTQMLLHGGAFDGARVLASSTVREMSQNQIGPLNMLPMKSAIPTVTNDAEFFPGMVKKWGFGQMITTEDAPTGRSAGSLAWAGLANSYYWIDPVKNVTGVLLTQLLPFADNQVLQAFAEYETEVYKLPTAVRD